MPSRLLSPRSVEQRMLNAAPKLVTIKRPPFSPAVVVKLVVSPFPGGEGWGEGDKRLK